MCRDLQEIGECESVSNEEGVDKEVALQDGDDLLGLLFGIFDVLLVVGILANQGTEPATKSGKELGVGERHPSNNRRVVLFLRESDIFRQ